MRKKYLSALLFGALLFASAGTFTSCKDYDEDINNLQNQITANADAIKALQELVNNGDYVTKVAKNADGNLVFTFSKSGDQIITLDEEQVGDVLSINAETGELIKNGEPTGWFATKNEEKEQQNCIKVGEDGCWQLLQDDGTYKSTNIPVSGVTAVQNTETKQWTLTIVDAQGNSQQVVIPSAASVMSDLVLAGWIETGDINDEGILKVSDINTAFKQESNKYTGTLNVEYCWLEKIIKVYDSNKETTWSAQKDVTKGQVLTSLRGKGVQLVTRVAPADLDLSGMKFTLQDSKGNTLPITLNSSTNFTGTITRAANSSINLIPLDVTTDTYASATAYANLYGENDNTLYSLVEESGARSNYGLAVEKTKLTSVKEQYVSKVDGKAPISESVGTDQNPTFQVEINTANKLTFGDKPEYVYDYYVEAEDQAVADLFNVSIDKKNGTFTVGKLADQITTTEFTLYVYALHIDGKIHRTEITIKPSRKMVNEATLAAGEQVIKQAMNNKKVDRPDWMKFDISLDAMFETLGTENTAKWTSATLGANTEFSVGKLKIDGQEVNLPNATTNKDNYYGIQLLDKDGNVLSSDKYYTAVTMRVYAKYLNQSDEATLEPGKNYELTIDFKNKNTDGDKEILNTVKMTYTPVLPALSDYMQKHESFWNSDKTVLLGVDNSINEAFDASGETLNYAIKDGFKKLGSTEDADKMTITFELADNKVNNKDFVTLDENQAVKYTEKDPSKNTNYGKEFTVKVAEVNYLTGYTYSAEEMAAQTFKMKVLSPIVEGSIEVKEGTSVEVYASRNAELNIADLIGYNYNKQSYNLYKDVVFDKEDETNKTAYEISAQHQGPADNYADKAIASVKFESGDTQVFSITDNMKPVPSSEGTPAQWNTTTKSVDTGIVTLDTSNISQDTQTTIKVTVTDIWGYEKTVEVPLTIKMAK